MIGAGGHDGDENAAVAVRAEIAQHRRITRVG